MLQPLFPYQNLFGMKIRFRAVLWVFCVFLDAHSQNLQDSIPLTQLEEVVVSDSRFPLKRTNSGKVIVKLTEPDLAAYCGLSVAEILNRQTGLELSGSRSRPGSILGVFARGGRGRQVLVLIDGIRYSDPSSYSREFDLRLLPADVIASIEILKGASSTLYGSNAATVVINITTKRGTADSPSIQLGSFTGTLNPYDSSDFKVGKTVNQANLSGKIENWFLTASIAQEYASGLSDLDTSTGEPDPNSLWMADFKLSRIWDGGIEINTFISRTGLRTSYDNSLSGTDANFNFASNQLRTGFDLTLRRKWGSLQWNTVFADFDSEDRSDYPFQYLGNSIVSELIFRRNWSKSIHLLSGLTFFRDGAEGKRFEILDPYLNAVLLSDSGWNLNAGMRVNIHSVYGATSVFSFNPSRVWYSDAGYLKVLASWSSAYITPSLPQLYGTFGANPDLKPERNRGGEAGVEWRSNKANFTTSGVLFQRTELSTVLFDGTNSRFLNSGSEIKARGLEYEINAQILPNLNLRAFYTYTHRSGDDAIRIPKHKGGILLDAGLAQNTRIVFDYQYTGSRPEMDFQSFTPVTLRAFSLLDLRWQYTRKPYKYRVYMVASNLFNTRYQEILGYSTPGRNFGMGWNLKLN